jgi:hypothetical protein
MMNSLNSDSNQSQNSSGRKRTPKSIGRSSGVANYSREDLITLLNLVEHFKPTGKNGWAKVTNKYNITVNVSVILLVE